jgi:threonine/homoserine efflux transporter RhtA
MDNILGAALGIVILLASIACFPIGFALDAASPVFLPLFFGLGVLLLSAALPVPIFLLDRLDGRN